MNLNQNKMNQVVAPTASGKTVLFELALLQFFESRHPSSSTSRAIYIAPLKSLVQEKYLSWKEKFPHLRLSELTSDGVCFSGQSQGAVWRIRQWFICFPDHVWTLFLSSQADFDLELGFSNFELFLATPEKFDAISRKIHGPLMGKECTVVCHGC